MKLTPSQTEIAIPNLLFDPEFYVFDIEPLAGRYKFLMMSEENLRLCPFIDIRAEPLAQASFYLDAGQVESLEANHDMVRPAVHYIFHHAFVCSTLMARGLDQLPQFISLKEPWILRRLADIKRSDHAGELAQGERWRTMFLTANRLLAKRYRSGHNVVVKATNVSNNLISDTLDYLPASKIVYMYSGLKDFLVSNLKKPAETREKMPWLLQQFLKDADFSLLLGRIQPVNQLTFLQVCALIWLTNMSVIEQHLRGANGRRILLLEMTDFLLQTPETLAQMVKHFEQPVASAELQALAQSDTFQRDAKNSEAKYSAEQKRIEKQALLDAYGGQIDAVMDWSAPLVALLSLDTYAKLD
ncbi:hypothetical protein GCM10008090_21440 [Arenicella chitinivorans]|uniref:Uncharacterized protein n=1 Tax=Arenicella chitinivorans TaxID=1329800 RepID=A0A918RST2_9GAMM|nr:hypothetical protein [Arenicella chitinivorans]GHA11388.1 hypothetical protein GCM10008090_21440 [Arenicella chitinivorans]